MTTSDGQIYTGQASATAPSPEPERIVEWVEEAYRETDKLLQAAGLRG